MLDLQEGYRRVRLSTGTHDLAAATRPEQAVIDALRDDPDAPGKALRALVRGTARTMASAKARALPPPGTLREAMDDALRDRRGSARLRSLDALR